MSAKYTAIVFLLSVIAATVGHFCDRKYLRDCSIACAMIALSALAFELFP